MGGVPLTGFKTFHFSTSLKAKHSGAREGDSAEQKKTNNIDLNLRTNYIPERGYPASRISRTG